MTDIAHASIDDLRPILEAFRQVEWPLSRSELGAVAGELGWQLESDRRRGATYVTGLPLAASYAEALLREDRVEQVKIDLTEVADGRGAASAQSLREAERELVEIATVVIGEPSGNLPRRRRTFWDLATGGRLAIANIQDLVILDVLGPTFADTERAEARLGVDPGRVTGVDPEPS